MGLASIISFTFLLLVANSQAYDYQSIHEQYLSCFHNSQDAYTPNNSSYSPILFSSGQNLRSYRKSRFKPSLIITPFHEHEIQTALRCAAKVKIPIRVRSGGHDYEGLSYSSSTTPFLLIDLRNFSSVSIDPEEKIAWVRSGATLGELYHKIGVTSKTLAFPAGACPTVGVGGHFSGGGYSMMSRKFGLAADNIIDARVMDANGEILDRKDMGKDHFWAIRGGGGTSFGIVLAWKIRLVSVPEKVTVFTVSKLMEKTATYKLLNKWQDVASRTDERLHIRIQIDTSYSLENGTKSVNISFPSMFLGGADELVAVMKSSFPELGVKEDDCKEMSWIESILYFASTYYPNKPTLDDLLKRTSPWRFYAKGKSDYVTRPIPEDGWKAICDRLTGDGGGVLWEIIPYGGRMSRISESATPFPHRAGTRFNIHYAILWTNETESASRLDSMTELYQFMGSYVSKSPRAAYFNYRDLDLGDGVSGDARVWGTKYFKKNFDRLVQVKTKVDPHNFFRNEQSIPPMTDSV